MYYCIDSQYCKSTAVRGPRHDTFPWWRQVRSHLLPLRIGTHGVVLVSD